ncbi:MAG TPA: NAD(P)/FAD-dependent oxidoreductase [Sphingobium sp.]|nr:NAD(P)/FAD-dependent oxidoreductase [Sphingobium sp.]
MADQALGSRHVAPAEVLNLDIGKEIPRRVLIVGAGFAGLACAQALGSSNAQVTVIDRHNYHLFVPLLYQVATAALSPADIAEPIRKILRRHANIDVVLGEVVGVDHARRQVQLADGGALAYDILILATGSSYNYFGHPEWDRYAPGLKTIADARLLRSRLLRAFELAEHEPNPAKQQALMTTVIVGGGPTGVEIAGSVAELARHALARDFRRIDPTSARIILVEAGPRILAAFPKELSAYAQGRLLALGVEVICGELVENIEANRVRIAGEDIFAGSVIWGAGIKASPAGKWVQAELDGVGRARVNEDLSVEGREGVYILGDSALLTDHATGRPLPGLAQVAQQQGRHLGRALKRHLADGTPIPPFRFRDRGNTAIIGRHAAVFDFGRRRLKGWIAWLLWAIVHVYLLVGFDNRLLVSMQWLWRYLTYERGARLITIEDDHHDSRA